MSIATELTNLAANRDAVKAAIEAKSPATAPTSALSSFPAAIASIPTGGGGGWQKPPNWPDIEAILEQDVTPQEAIDAGATKKWIMLCNSGQPGNGVSTYGFRSGKQVYFRVSDGIESYEQSASSSLDVQPLDNGIPFWIIVYTTDSNAQTPSPNFTPYWVIGPLWIYAPDHDFTDTNHYCSSWISLRCFKAKSYTTSAYNSGFVGCGVLECVSLSSFTAIGNASSIFSGCSCLSSLDTSVITFSNVNSLENAFNGCRMFGVYDMHNLDVSGVTNMASIFNGTSVTELDLHGWDTSNVTSLYNAFYNCVQLQKLNLTGWNTGKCSGSGLRQMFYNCYQLRGVDMSGFVIGTGITDLLSMFSSCRTLESLDVSHFDMTHVSGGNSVKYMFAHCIKLKTLDISGWDCVVLQSFDSAFSGCASLETIIGSKTVASDGSVDGSTAYFGKGPKVSFKLSDSPLLGRDSLLYLMYWVPSVSGQTMTLGATNLAKLTADEKAVATAKGWTLA